MSPKIIYISDRSVINTSQQKYRRAYSSFAYGTSQPSSCYPLNRVKIKSSLSNFKRNLPTQKLTDKELESLALEATQRLLSEHDFSKTIRLSKNPSIRDLLRIDQ